MSETNQKNSFVSLLEQIALLNKNSVEVLTKINGIVSSNQNSVSIDYLLDDGTTSKYQMPTVGFLKNQIDIANSNIKKLTSLDDNNSVIIIDNNTSKKIQSIDLSREPNQIQNVNLVSSFQQTNNWFFESLMNPLISININLDTLIDDHIGKILSRRYIIKFEKDVNNQYTTAGLNSLQEFQTLFLNKNNFTISDFIAWVTKPSNIGVLNISDNNQYMDEQIFDLNLKEVNYKGYFSVFKMEVDSLNNKMWYHFNTLSYYGKDGSTNTLSIGDKLAINSTNSYTTYKVIEINTSSSLFRVALERLDGYDPVPIGTSVLQYYSQLNSNKNVKITIGFDEYNVVFVKPINTDNNIIASNWSNGMAYYTNDLVLDTDNNVSMTDFYLNKVYDYGALLKDMVVKQIPSSVGLTPNSPTLVNSNFKVVQINQHLTDTKSASMIKDLYSQKTSAKSSLQQINNAITEKNKELNTKTFKSVAEKSSSQNELNKLIKKQDATTKLYTSYVSQISSTKIDNTADPKFRVRGFWAMPTPVTPLYSKPQEVIGFEIQYRYASKTGSVNQTKGFEVNLTNTLSTKKTTGYYSEWIPFKTDIRKRVYDKDKNQWTWQIEDVSDADTPNINQLDIPIQKNEKVEIRIRSISEVGYPDAILESDWSQIMTIEFPDDLNQVLGENEFILKEASQEEILVQFNTEFEAKGYPKHISDSFYANEQYFGHLDKNISTSFKDSLGNVVPLYDYLVQLNNRVSQLEEIVKRAKGELKVTLFNGTNETVISNNSIINCIINCDDYAINSGSTSLTKKYVNNVYLIQDYYLLFENIAAENTLGLFNMPISDHQAPNLTNYSTLVDKEGKLRTQSLTNKQFICLEYQDTIDNIITNLYDGINNTGSTTTVSKVLTTNNTNIGGSFDYVLTSEYWNTNTANTYDNFLAATIHPWVTDTSFLVDNNITGIHNLNAQESIKLPISIYFKMNISGATGDVTTFTTSSDPAILNKRIRLYLQDENSFQAFTFSLNFTFNQYKQYTVVNNGNIIANQSNQTI